MTVSLPFFVGALVLLWFPRLWLRRGFARLTPARRRPVQQPHITEPWREREPGDPQINFRAEFTKIVNYADLLRAGLGGWLLWGGWGLPSALAVADDATPTTLAVAQGMRALVLLAGLLVQTMRREKERLSFFPPVFYLGGLSLALCDLPGAAFAFVLIWAVNPSLPNARVFLSLYAVLLLGFGRFFGGAGTQAVLLAAGLTFLPVLLSLLANRPLTVFARKAHRTGRHP
jgi:hypothetical protein